VFGPTAISGAVLNTQLMLATGSATSHPSPSRQRDMRSFTSFGTAQRGALCEVNSSPAKGAARRGDRRVTLATAEMALAAMSEPQQAPDLPDWARAGNNSSLVRRGLSSEDAQSLYPSIACIFVAK
jgi:hypothetical protein